MDKREKIENCISKLRQILNDMHSNRLLYLNKDLLRRALKLDLPVTLYSDRGLTIYWPRIDIGLDDNKLMWDPTSIIIKLEPYISTSAIFCYDCRIENKLYYFLNDEEYDIFVHNVYKLISHLKSRSEEVKQLLIYEAI